MKTLQVRVRQVARHSRVSQLVVERDYAQSYVLLGLASRPELRGSLIFKGGTALRKVHFGSYRFSEDLDFSAVAAPTGPELEAAIHAAVAEGRAAARQFSPMDMRVERYAEREPHPRGQEAFVVRVRFPWQRDHVVPVIVEVTHDEPVLLPTPPLAVFHDYDEPFDAAVCAYSLDEIAAEKLRAPRQTLATLTARGWVRPRARDYFDLWHLVRLEPGRIDWARVAAILPRKCAHREVTITTVSEVFEPRLLDEVRATWQRTLGPFVGELPDVELVLSETRARLDELLEF